jgi:hypothetical protein
MTVEVYAGADKSHDPQEKLGEAAIWFRRGVVELTFSESRGLGNRTYHLRIKSADFKMMAEAMMRSNSELAIKAFGAALQLGITLASEDTYRV